MACRSPVIIQHANISQPATRAPPPIAKKMNITSRAFSTISSLLEAKESVMSPHSSANEGMAAPITNEDIDPITISKTSVLSAKRNNSKNSTFSSFSYSGIFFYVISLLVMKLDTESLIKISEVAKFPYYILIALLHLKYLI